MFLVVLRVTEMAQGTGLQALRGRRPKSRFNP